MADVVFFGMPEDSTALKQRNKLEAAGHYVTFRDVMAEPWTAETLMQFLDGKPVEQWFHKMHADVRSGAVTPASLSAEAALGLLLSRPDLIRRPLLQVGEDRSIGFDPNFLEGWIGIAPKGDGLTCDERHKQGRCDHGHMTF